MIFVFLGFLYLCVAGVMGGYAHFRYRAEKADDRTVASFVCGAFWPIASALWFSIFLAHRVTNTCQAIGEAQGAKLYSRKVAATKGQMMEDDVERVGGSTDVLVQYDYVACPVCFGKGCKKCSDVGVIRKKRTFA